MAGTKEAMAEKVDPEAEPNVLQNRKTSLSDLFSGEALEDLPAQDRRIVPARSWLRPAQSSVLR
jgi:hypothetical protein